MTDGAVVTNNTGNRQRNIHAWSKITYIQISNTKAYVANMIRLCRYERDYGDFVTYC